MEYRSDEIEADFQHYYRIDLADLWQRKMTLRRFSVLLFGLPAGAVTWRAQGGHLAWSDEVAAANSIKLAVENLTVTLARVFGNSVQDPKPAQPPAWGWQEIAQADVDLNTRRARKLRERRERKEKRLREKRFVDN